MPYALRPTARATSLIFALAMLAGGPATVAAADTAPALIDPAAATAAIASAAPSAFPDADTLTIDDQSHITVAADGAYDNLSESYTKILTDKGRRSLATRSYSFNRFYGDLVVLRLEVLKADGRRVELDPLAQSKEAVDRAMMGANIYDPNDRIITVSIPGLDLGDTLHLLLRQRETPRMAGAYGDIFSFEGPSPILHQVVEISATAANPLRSIAVLGELPSTITHRERREGDRIIHTWEGRGIPQAFPEPRMPSLDACGQRLLVSTSSDWQTVSKWYWQLCAPHLKATPAITAKAAELTRGVADRMEKIKRIFRFVSQEIRYMGITTETTAPGYEPHDVAITFDNRYGVCRDKAALLASMLRGAGIEAFPVLIMVGPKRDAEVPIPYFNHAITAVADDAGGYQLMDATNENTAELMPNYLHDLSYLVARPEGDSLHTSSVAPAEDNLASAETSAEIAADGTLTCSSVISFTGINDGTLRASFAAAKAEDIHRFFERLVKDIAPGATLTRLAVTPENALDTTQPMAVRLAFTAADYLTVSDGATLLRTPWVAPHLAVVNRLLDHVADLDQRRFPLRLDYTCGLRETVAITLPPTAGATLALPESPAVEAPGLFFRKSFTRNGSVVTAKLEEQLRTPEFAPTAYAALKSALKDIDYASRQMPIIAMRDAAAAVGDLRTLSSTTTVQLEDAHAWTTTTTVTKQVLTYAGKKRSSELHLDYVPAWTEVTVDYARVTGPDGTVKQVKTQEMNLMDSDWVANAPRYPVGKTLVVSLPGVEIGSTIAYQVTSRNRLRPFVSGTWIFASADPVDSRRVTIIAPATLPLAIDDRAGATTTHPDPRHLQLDAAGQRRILHEDSLPRGLAPMLAISTCASDADYARLVGETVLPLAAPTAPISAKAALLIAASHDERSKIIAIRDFIDHAIRQAGPSFTRLPLSALSRAETTLADGYGNGADRMILLHALLTAAGLKPEFVLVAGSPAKVVERDGGPLLDDFYDELGVRIQLDGRPTYLSDLSEYAQLGTTRFDGCVAIGLDGQPARTVHAEPAMVSRTDCGYDIVLDAAGTATVRVTQHFPGAGYADFRRGFADLQPEERRRYLQRCLHALSESAQADGELVIDTAYPGTMTFAARIPRFAVRSGRFAYFDLPEAAGRTLVPATSGDRQLPLLMGGLSHTAIRWSVVVPAGMRVQTRPEDVEWQGPGATGSVHLLATEKRQDDGSVLLERSEIIDFAPGIVPAASYPALLELNRRLSRPLAWRVVLADEAK